MKEKRDDKPSAANILEKLRSGIREGFDSSDNIANCLYGPPEMLNPSNNEIEGVYGPPDFFNPSQNEPIDVYGPPSLFNPSQNEPIDVYGPPDDPNYDNGEYDSSINIAPPVYGPPA